MFYNDPSPVRRRIPFRLEDSDGVAITGKGAELAAPGAIKVNASGMVANALGTVTEIGGGEYYYQPPQAETATWSFIAIRVVIAEMESPVVICIDIGSRMAVGESDANKRRMPLYLVDETGIEVTGLDLGSSVLEIAAASNGYAYAAFAGSWGESGFGMYWVAPVPAEISAVGVALLRVTDVAIATFVLAFDVVAVVPVISTVTPAEGATPGSPGAFSAQYATARTTPIEFDLTGLGSGVTISAKFANRDETYVALDHDGQWRWPFDVHSTIGDLSAEPVHVLLLPRDGWPPVPVEIRVAAVQPAEEAP